MKGLFISLIALLSISCSFSPSNHPDKASFVVAIDSAPTQLDPRFATDAYSERIDHLLFRSLIRIGPHEEILPDLAKQWEVDGNSYTFTLHENILFHDKSPLTSEDVRYTYESILNPETESPHRKGYEMIERIETPAPAVVRFILKENYAPFLSILTRGIIPKRLVTTDPERFAKQLVGSGPFVFVSYEPDHAVTLRANLDYPVPPTMDLLFRIIPEESTRLLALEKGVIDLLQNATPPDALPRLLKNPLLKVVQAPSTTYSYLGFNLSDPVLKQQKVREAIAHAIDKEAMTKHLFRGLVTEADSLFTNRHWAFAKTKATPYDPSLSEALLEEAGFPYQKAFGGRLRLTYKTSQNELGRRVAEVIQSQLSRVGILVTIRSFEWGTFYADVKSGNFQLFSLSWVGVHDPDIYTDLFHSESVPPNGSNRVRYNNSRVDLLLSRGRILLDQTERAAVYREVQEILAEELPYVSLWHPQNVAVMKKEVMGYTLYSNGDFYSLKDVRRR
jgi:peptide/nickel transport system substrate-binding protein